MTTQTADLEESPEAIATDTNDRAVFTISTDAAADWYLQRLASIAAERARIETQAARMLADLDSDRKRLEHLFGSQMESYCRQKLQESKRKKRKFVDFWQGRCSFRTVPSAVFVSDPVAALEYARASAPEAIKTEERLDGDAYRKLAEKALGDGKTLPGTDRRPEKESFSISFPTGKSED